MRKFRYGDCYHTDRTFTCKNMKEVTLLQNKKSLIINGLAVIFAFLLILPCNALSIQSSQREIVVENDLSSFSVPEDIDEVIDIESIQLEKIYIDDAAIKSPEVSRSANAPREKLVAKTDIEPVETSDSAVENSSHAEIQPVAQEMVTPPTEPRAIIHEVALANGCTQSEIDLLMKIADRESSFNPNAISPNGNCVGLFQLDSNKGPKNQRLDPFFNTAKAIEYMRVRYGSIERAYSFRQNNGWY